MIHTARTVRTLQAVAMTVGLSVLLWSIGVPTFFLKVEAASITSASDTLTVSAPSTASNHTISFSTPNGMIPNGTLTLTFDGNFTNMGSLVEDDVDLVVGGVSTTTAGSAGPGTWGVGFGGSVITLTAPSDGGIGSSTQVTIRIGNNAVDFGTGSNQIVNPVSTTSFPIDIGGSMQDSGQVRVAIVDQVQVSASVNTSLTFTVSGVGSGQVVNGSGTTTVAASTYNTLPFGLLPIDTSVTLAHDLLVTTNASNGYTVTVEQSQEFQSSVGDTIDSFIDGAYTASPAPWIGPAATVASPNTYGHWGLTSEDPVIPARTGDDFASDEWIAASTTPIAIMGHDDPVLATTTRIGYQVQISGLQEASTEYSTQLRYIATPTY
jgi:hypothetical protein